MQDILEEDQQPSYELSIEESEPLLYRTSTQPTCRICYDDDPKKTLISPCQCSGTMQYVHRECLLEWLKNSPRSHRCEICHEEYNSSLIPFYKKCFSKYKCIFRWAYIYSAFLSSIFITFVSMDSPKYSILCMEIYFVINIILFTVYFIAKYFKNIFIVWKTIYSFSSYCFMFMQYSFDTDDYDGIPSGDKIDFHFNLNVQYIILIDLFAWVLIFFLDYLEQTQHPSTGEVIDV